MNTKRLIVLISVAGIIIAARFSPLGTMFTFKNLVQYKMILQHTVHTNYIISVIAFLLLYFASVALSIPGAAILTIAGGLLFGIFPAMVYVNIAATAGATGAFLIAKYLFGDWIHKRYKKKLAPLNQKLESHGQYYLLFLRLIPIFPFFLINIGAGISKLTVKTFIWTTSIGIIPGSFLYTFAGRQIDSIARPSDIMSWKILIVLILLGLLALLPTLFKKEIHG